MANADKPFGFRFAYTTHGGPPIIRKLKCTAAIVYPGDMVHWDGSGRLNSAASSDSNFGVAVSYAPAVAGTTVYVMDTANCVFTVQADAAAFTDDTEIGNYFDVTATTGDTTTLQSKHELDDNASTADTLELLGLVDRPDNAWGANCDVYVRFHVNTGAEIVAKTA